MLFFTFFSGDIHNIPPNPEGFLFVLTNPVIKHDMSILFYFYIFNDCENKFK